MLCLSWPRLRRPALLGARPMIAGCLILITASVIVTLHAGICVGGMWRCRSEKKDNSKGPNAIIQLRRNVAATLIRVAANVRSGNTVSAAAELEATAALLDNRYSSKVKGPPLLRPGVYIPPPLGYPSSSSTIKMLAREPEETYDEFPGRKGTKRDLLVDSTKYVSESTLKNLDQNQNKDASLILDKLRNYLSNSISVRDRKEKNNSSTDAATLKEEKSTVRPIDWDVGYKEKDGDPRQVINLDEIASLKSAFQVEPIDLLNILPGEAELEDLGDEPLPSLNSQISILVEGCGSSPPYIVSVVRQAVAIWPGMTIIVGVAEEERAEIEDISHWPEVTIITVPCEKWRRTDIDTMARHITTPFTLFLDGLSAITDDLNLTRLLSITIGLKSLGVGVVGAAERGRDGHWDYTCTRITLENSRLTLRDGYDFSRAACLFCDVTSSSFLAVTHILSDIPFDSNMPHKSQMIDWALQLQRQGILTMTCPDVMFHVQRKIKPNEQHREVDQTCITKEDKKQARALTWAIKRQYKKLVQKWEINYVTFNNGTSFEYSCREMRFECNAYHNVKHYILPPCCIKMKHKMFNTVDIIAKENHIPYEISSGTLLGAMKFKDGLPWDFDDDAYYRNADVEIFKRNRWRMRRLGLSPYFSDQVNRANSSFISKYIYSTSHGGFFMDLWGLNKMSSTGTLNTLGKYPDNLACLQYGHIPTTIKTAKTIELNRTRNVKTKKPTSPSCYLSSIIRVGSNWLPGPWNPGKKALSHYGDNLYRHQGHWRWSSIENPGWVRCPRPGHHTCLDIHPMDGSLPFQ